jgi:formylglycine-generating enzyme required for sulfatase activity
MSGCIVSKTPNTNDVTIPLGEQVTFSVKVFPSTGDLAWTLDGTHLSNTGNSYVYTAQCGQHALTVYATHILGKDTQTWNILTEGPICDLLNSMVSIPGGTFQMGSTDDEHGWANHTTPVHAVTLQGFQIGAYELTQTQYAAIMGNNPSYFQGTSYPGTENNPVEQVTWYDAREFCTALSAQTGRTFTLPSEAQWEYACRAGSTTLYSFGDDDGLLGDYAWYWAPPTHPVGTKLPNAWGLYDMHGNVFEWCLDSWHTSYDGAPTDGSAWEPETIWDHVIRGGSWYYNVGRWRSADRLAEAPYGRFNFVGFRVVAVPTGG